MLPGQHALPGEWALRRIIEEVRGGVLGRASGAHGRRSGEVDGLPHETLPYITPHDCWTMDELVLPAWTKMYSDERDRVVSGMVYVILILDYVSRVILGYHICDPRRRRGENDQQVFTGWDEADVMAAFLKVARRELAPPFLQRYAGYLPGDIRMDGHSTHHKWAKAVKAFIPTRVHLLGDYRPYRNGVQERAGGTTKAIFSTIFADMWGSFGKYLPEDRVRQNQHDARVQAAATSYRVRRKILIAPEDLPDIETVADIGLPAVIQRYNQERVHSALGMTPHAAYMSLVRSPRHLHPGESLVHALPVKAVQVSGASLQYEADNVVRRFSAQVEGKQFIRGATVTVHVHPLHQSIWAVEGDDHHLVHIPTLRDAAARQAPAYIAHMSAALTGGLSGATQAAFNEIINAGKRALSDRPSASGSKAPSESREGSPAGENPGRTATDVDSPGARIPDPNPTSTDSDLTEAVVRASTAPVNFVTMWLTPVDVVPAPSDSANTSPSDTPAGAQPVTPLPPITAAPSPRDTPRAERRTSHAFWLQGAIPASETIASPPAPPVTSPTESPSDDASATAA
jgi:hypothetical protein